MKVTLLLVLFFFAIHSTTWSQKKEEPLLKTYKIEYRSYYNFDNAKGFTEEEKAEIAADTLFYNTNKILATHYLNDLYQKIIENRVSNDKIAIIDKKKQIHYEVDEVYRTAIKTPFDTQIPRVKKASLPDGNTMSPSWLQTKETDTIAGYLAQKMLLDIPEEGLKNQQTTPETFESMSFEIWYTNDLPYIFWDRFPNTGEIPGAILAGFIGVDGSVSGIKAAPITEEYLPASFFEIPEDYILKSNDEINNTHYLTAKDEIADAIDEDYKIDTEFKNGYRWVVKKDDSYYDVYGVEDKNGKLILPHRFSYYSSFYDDVAVVIDSKSKLYGLINKKGKLIVPCKYNYIYNSSDYGIIFTEVNKYGVFNTKGKVIAPAIYDYIFSFKNGMAVVKQDYFYGYINTKGKLVIPLKYDYGYDFDETGKAQVFIKEDSFYINTKGKRVD